MVPYVVDPMQRIKWQEQTGDAGKSTQLFQHFCSSSYNGQPAHSVKSPVCRSVHEVLALATARKRICSQSFIAFEK